jgi:hypothetical protein
MVIKVLKHKMAKRRRLLPIMLVVIKLIQHKMAKPKKRKNDENQINI